MRPEPERFKGATVVVGIPAIHEEHTVDVLTCHAVAVLNKNGWSCAFECR